MKVLIKKRTAALLLSTLCTKTLVLFAIILTTLAPTAPALAKTDDELRVDANWSLFVAAHKEEWDKNDSIMVCNGVELPRPR